MMNGFERFYSRLIVEGVLETHTPLHVGMGRAVGASAPDLPVIKDALGRPVIPGSGLKGPVRSHIEALLRALQPEDNPFLACDMDYENKGSACVNYEDVRQIIDRGLPTDERDAEIMNSLCLTCRVFGSPWMASKVMFRDAMLADDSWAQVYPIRDGVSIDRDRGIVKEKYDYEIVPSHTRFIFKMQLDNASDEEMGLMLLALKALEQEQILFGGAHRAGAGWCRLTAVTPILYTDPVEMLLNQPGDLNEQAKINAFLAYAGVNNHA
jgi:CRISPR-associated RAMP protein (TIGR02581 family)